MPHELLMSMRICVFLNMGKWEIGSGKQILTPAYPKGKLKFSRALIMATFLALEGWGTLYGGLYWEA